MKPENIFVYLPYEYNGTGSGYTPVAVAQGFEALGTDVSLYVRSATEKLPRLHQVFDSTPRSVIDKVRNRIIGPAVERQLLQAVKGSPGRPVVWLWPDASLKYVRQLKDAGALIVREMINTHRGTARRILEAEGKKQGVDLHSHISPQSIQLEQDELALADYIVSPSEEVDASLAEWHVPDRKVLRSFFGWDPGRISSEHGAASAGEELQVLFVGLISMRKGVHLALEAWNKAKVPGKFVLLGRISNEMTEIVKAHLSLGNVEHHGFTRNIAPIFRSSDFMLFPTLEEGAPLVCYEAAGAGLPILTSPMGKARIVVDGRNGLVVDPADGDALVEAIRKLAGSPELRSQMSAAITEDSKQRTWTHAAESRLAELTARLAQ